MRYFIGIRRRIDRLDIERKKANLFDVHFGMLFRSYGHLMGECGWHGAAPNMPAEVRKNTLDLPFDRLKGVGRLAVVLIGGDAEGHVLFNPHFSSVWSVVERWIAVLFAQNQLSGKPDRLAHLVNDSLYIERGKYENTARINSTSHSNYDSSCVWKLQQQHQSLRWKFGEQHQSPCQYHRHGEHVVWSPESYHHEGNDRHVEE